MNWPVVLQHRQAALGALLQARKHAVYAGDRPVVDYLDGAINRQRDRVRYARKMVSRGPRVFTLVGARFAAPADRRDTGPATGGAHER